MNKKILLARISEICICNKEIKSLYNEISGAITDAINSDWQDSVRSNRRTAYYLSMEFLVGRAFFNNLMELGILNEVKKILAENGIDINMFEEIEDAALGNGGLGRLAACFLDSAANLGLPLHGYGIRYKYGLFRQAFENGFQKELPDDWQAFGDPWGVRKASETREIRFADFTVSAVPYDYPVIGENGTINTLRLWQAEGSDGAEKISEYLYPDDKDEAGKLLRIRQEYFFSAAAVGDLLEKYFKSHRGLEDFIMLHSIQLNDTHPVFAIAEFVHILHKKYHFSFLEAVIAARKAFNYTNHTIMAEALEKWDCALVKKILPDIYTAILRIDKFAREEWRLLKCSADDIRQMAIYDGKRFHMANLAVFASKHINGVAKLHSEILKSETLKASYKYYPGKFQNKTNGITQRRWLMLCNSELSGFIDERIGDGWRKDISLIKQLESFDGLSDIDELLRVKRTKKEQLAKYIKECEGIEINPDSIFYVQVKRLHEYKRQLMAALGILSVYDGLKSGNIKDFTPSTFIFGAKAAAGYKRAKAIIKLINEIAALVNNDPATKNLLKVVFVQNYNVSYAEKIIPAADVSLQISTAGLEASGTGNMKFMLNGAVTLGTMDGANIEIAELAGGENNYIFGARVDDIRKLKKDYNPKSIISENAMIKNVLSYLLNGKLCDGNSGYFKELYTALTEKTYNDADNYFVLYDLAEFIEAVMQVNKDYKQKTLFMNKIIKNIANAAFFSSDRTIKEYAKDIWEI